MAWTTSDRVMALRRRSVAIDVAVATLDGWRRHLSGRNASLVAFFAFLSIFPLLLAATTILGFVLESNADLRERIVDGALADLPVLGPELERDPAALTGNVWALLIGLLGALWSSTKAFVALHGALDDVWEIDLDDRAPMPKKRAKALLGLVFIGAAQIANLVVSTLVNAAGLPGVGRILLVLATVVVNVVVLAATYRFLTSASPAWRVVAPGAALAGVVFTLLQHFGTAIVHRITENASDTYGQFALVLGLVTWLSLLAITALMCAEMNRVLAVRHGALPASAGRAPSAPGDVAAQATAEPTTR